jgi:3-oxoacyl-[acyl-carrier protein] reductase
MDLGLDGRVYAVTGGTAGLGLATAQALVADGARVVVSSRTAERVAAAVELLGPDAAEGVVADNADPATPDLLEAAWQRWGRIDGGLISVGGPPAAPVLDTTDEQWEQAFHSVFLGAVRVARRLADRLASGGSIAFVLSTSVKVPLRHLATSNGLRPGLAMVAKQLADEVGPQGIRVNSLLPGRFATARVAELDALTGDSEASRAAHEKNVPLRRYGEAEEFGKVAAFVLSPAASFVSGAAIPVDGGLLRAS